MRIKFSASAKLYTLIFITAASLVGLGLYGINDLKEMNDNTRSLYADRVLCMQQLANVRFEYTSEILPIPRLVKDQVVSFSEAKKRVEKAEGIINANWHDYKLTYLTPEEALLVKQTDVIKSEADKASENLKSILSEEDKTALDELVQKEPSTKPSAIVLKMTQLMALQTRVSKDVYNNNKQIFQRTSKKFILLILLTLAIALSLSFYIIKNIKNLIKDRLKSNKIIKESEEKYRSLIEQASDAIYLVDDKGNFTEVNESMCKMTGYIKEELLQLNVEEIVDPNQLKTDPLIHGYHLPDRSLIKERRMVRKDRTIFDVEINVKLFGNNKMLVIARDITDRKRMEEDLREAEIKFRTLAEKSMVGIYIIREDKFLYLNPRYAEIFGYEHDELANEQGSLIDLLISKDDREIVRRNTQARYSGEAKNIHYEVTGEKKDGTQNKVEFYGSGVIISGRPAIIGTAIDITQRKRAEEELRSSEQKYKLLFESNPSPLWMIAKDDLSVIAVNEAAANLYGYTKDELMHSNAKIVRLEEDIEQQRLNFQTDVTGPTDRGITRHVKKDGTIIFVNVIVNDITFEGRMVRLVLTTDITEKLIAEEELRSSEQKYKLLFESNPSPMLMIAKDDMSIIAVNEALTILYGYSKDELLQMTVRELRPIEDSEEQLEIFRMEASGSADLGVIRVIRHDGSIIFVHLIGHDIMFEGRPVRLALVTDVTERLKAEAALRKSEANLQTILKTTDTAYALFDLELKVQAFNQKAIEFVKHEYYHLPQKGDRLVDFFPLDRFPQFMNFTRAVLKGNNINYEIDYPQADGSVTWYYVSLFPITNDGKEILGMMMSLYDITERKNAEHDLKSAYERIQSHINSIKDMAWKQSHLIRSPLANLKGLAEMLKEDPSDTDVLEFIQNELNRMDTIIIEMADVPDYDTN